MKSKNKTGFTIIEVMIVVAIAAIILLIVLLAVPALMRAKRNTERKHDAAFIVEQRIQYDTNEITTFYNPPSSGNCIPPQTPHSLCSYITDSLSYYDPSNITVVYNENVKPTTVPVVTDPDKITLESYLACNSSGTGAVLTDNHSLAVVLFALEASSGSQPQCIQSQIYHSE